MGACSFVVDTIAASAKEGYQMLVEEARDYYGNDAYNGTISTTGFRGVKAKTADKVSKTSVNKACKKADEELDRCRKWDCYAIDCGVDHYEVVSMKRDSSFKSKGAPKYETKFLICDWKGCPINNKSYPNQTAAKDDIMRMAAAGKLDQSVYIAKRHVLVSGQEELAHFTPEVKTYKSKPKNVPAGSVLKEFRKFVYYGWASC